MNHVLSPRRWTMVLATAFVYSAAAAPVWSVDCDANQLRFELAEGEDRLECRLRDQITEDVYISGSGRIEVSITLEIGPDALEQLWIDYALWQRSFRKELFNPQDYHLGLGVVPQKDMPDTFPGIDRSDGTLGEYYELVIVVKRVTTNCSMIALVDGDVTNATFGDVAYYNFFKEGVKEGMASGTFLDPVANEALQGLTGVDFTDWVTGFLDEDEDEKKDEQSNSDSGGDEKPESPPVLNEGWDLSGNDNFGLSLVDVKFDVDGPPVVVEDPADRTDPIGKILQGDPQATAEFAGAMAYLGSSFSLAASGSTKWDGGEEYPEEEEPRFFTVELSSLIVAPGAMDANVSGVKFRWVPGQPGSGIVVFHDTGGGVLLGHVRGELYTEKPYQDGRLRINVYAEFVAREGAYTCD